jgi:hypothetical protein
MTTTNTIPTSSSNDAVFAYPRPPVIADHDPSTQSIVAGGCWYPPYHCFPHDRLPPRPAEEFRRAVTVEDRILERLCKIMAQMDAEIEADAKEIEALQAGTAAGGAGDKSVDIQTMKLKHKIDQRTALFDMLRQIMDKYQQTTNEVVRSMGR